MARIPAKHVSASDKDVLRNLERNLKMVVFGQEQAIEVLTAAIKMSRSGLGDPNKPIGCFLFAGPTGVGKTEVTRQLAMILGIELIRFDMSEYMESHSVSRLVGAPPGYVGFDQGGLLTEAVTKHPHAVLLLDEIEKAHPDVFNLLLQVMDRGVLTDTNGREANFRNVVLVMTTNAGASQASRRSMGFVEQDHSTDAMEVIRRGFTPEFRNRLDAIIQFSRAGSSDHPARGRQVHHRTGIAAGRQARHAARRRDGAGVAGGEGLRPANGRATDVARDPGARQAQARRRTAVRRAGQRRQGFGGRA